MEPELLILNIPGLPAVIPIIPVYPDAFEKVNVFVLVKFTLPPKYVSFDTANPPKTVKLPPLPKPVAFVVLTKEPVLAFNAPVVIFV